MYKLTCILFLFFLLQDATAQKDAYTQSLRAYQKKYVGEHEVVNAADKKYFRFFPISKLYCVNARFERIFDTTGFTMKTSANTLKAYFKYGKLSFRIAGTDCQLFVYQSKDLMKTDKYKDYLFVPFTDLSTGDESYGSGRYLEFYKQDVQSDGTLLLDFNKAYNPYCAYSAGFKCPIPPRENALNVAIRAGEKNFAKPH